MKMCILMNPSDNVATVLQDTNTNDRLSIVDQDKKKVGEVVAAADIPFAHKICVQPIHQASVVLKFGVVIGRATSDIPLGGYAHIHNVISIKGSEDVVGGGKRS